MRPCATKFLSRFLPPRRWAREPAWAWPRFMASSSSIRGGLKLNPSRVSARCSRSFCPWRKGRRKARPNPEPISIRAADVQPRTIFLVEDEAPLREMASMILKRLGHQVVVAQDGPEALSLWPQHRGKIDLLFTDMVMPGGITGRELADHLLREEPRHARHLFHRLQRGFVQFRTSNSSKASIVCSSLTMPPPWFARSKKPLPTEINAGRPPLCLESPLPLFQIPHATVAQTFPVALRMGFDPVFAGLQLHVLPDEHAVCAIAAFAL